MERLRATALVALALAMAFVVAACGDDDTSTLTADERSWCSFTGQSEQDASRFDVIFEAGTALGINMDRVNAQASGRRAELLADGMTLDEAVKTVSEELMDDGDFVVACKAAYAEAHA